MTKAKQKAAVKHVAKAKPAARKVAATKAKVALHRPAPVAAKAPIAKVPPAKLAAPKVAAGKKPAVPAKPVPEAPPRKLKLSKADSEKFHKLLLDLRDHLIDGVSFLASDNLKRSTREASGELSGYSLHMADAGTDNFDREFALSLVSSEQEGLYEIEEALKRMEQGTYGVCEMCEKLIVRERLEAVPFARLCIHCQSAIEKDRRGMARPAASFTETADDEAGEGEEAEE
jgi:RNA polymerase-binding transcription factor DksA